jgi:hypothetical protein
VAIGQKGSHRGGRLTMVNSVAVGNSTAAWTNNHRRWPSGHRGMGCLGEDGEVASSAER